MEDEEEVMTPFWVQSSSNRRLRRRPSPSLFLNSGLLLFTLCIALSLFVFFIVPSLLSLTPRIFRPNLFKKSWDSLNITLVLLALIFGFLSRNINHDDQSDSTINNRNELLNSNQSTPRGWHEYPDRTAVVGLRRSYSSYPDLHELQDPVERWRFYDDTLLPTRPSEPPPVSPVQPAVNTGTLVRETAVSNPGSNSRLNELRRTILEENVDRNPNKRFESVIGRERIIEPVDGDRASHQAPVVSYRTHLTTEAPAVRRMTQRTTEAPAVSVRTRQTTEASAVRRIARRTAEPKIDDEKSSDQVSSLEPGEHRGRLKTKRVDEKEESTKLTTYRSASPPSRIETKRSGNATKHFIDSFRKKKKKQRQKSVESVESLLESHHPPPPPPPPPRNFFSSKREKIKKTITVPPPQPPPPPPPPLSRAVVSATAASRTLATGGGESPLRPIPPPPPPPPFKISGWKFVVKGDFVRIGSMGSSRSVSPEPSEVDSPTSSGGSPAGVEEREGTAGEMFCPSPDVNSKADMFIAKFRAGLKLQKMNSMNQKQGLGLSNLGPAINPRSASRLSSD